MRPVQKFSAEYLDRCRKMSVEEIVEFVENFRELHAGIQQKPGSVLISLRVPVALLNAFKSRSRLEGVPYQTQIKRLMKQWLD